MNIVKMLTALIFATEWKGHLLEKYTMEEMFVTKDTWTFVLEFWVFSSLKIFVKWKKAFLNAMKTSMILKIPFLSKNTHYNIRTVLKLYQSNDGKTVLSTIKLHNYELWNCCTILSTMLLHFVFLRMQIIMFVLLSNRNSFLISWYFAVKKESEGPI